MFKLHVALMCLASAGVYAQSIGERAQKDDIVFMRDADPAMDRAFRLARESLDDFLAKLKEPPAGTSSYAIKVGVKDGQDTEYFWLNEVSTDGRKYSGRIDNQPRMVRNVRMGKTYSFSRDEVVDWMYLDRGARRMHGNFTACALLSKESKADAESFKKQYGLVCE